jgi:uncharacterized protein (TIGR02001 family)
VALLRRQSPPNPITRLRTTSASSLTTVFDPALQGGIDFTHKSGFYLGAWASNIKWIKDAGGKNSNVEIDLYGGYRGTVSELGYDLGVLTYVYPGHKGFLPVNPETTELYGALTYGPVTAKYSHAVTNAFGNANSTDSGYLEAAATFDLGKGWSVAPHIGHQRIAGAGNGVFSYTDYSLTVNYDFGNGVVASVAALGTDAKKGAYVTPSGRNTGRDGLVLGLKYSF